MRHPVSLGADDRPVRVQFRNTGADSAIIFIHGFAGQAEKTWGKFPQFLMEHSELTDWDIFGAGYSSKIWNMPGASAQDAGLESLGYYLRATLAHAPLDRYKRLAIVAHSMGGLIAQQALLDESTRSRISHLFLFGTPNVGTRGARLFRGLHQQARDLVAGSEFITHLRAAWTTTYGGRHPFEVRVIAGERDNIIPVESAFGEFADNLRFVVPGDHFTMVKPENAASLSVQLVVRGLLGKRTPNNLPLQLTSFIGREDELEAVKSLLRESLLVTLVGTGGIGKTRLSIQVGADMLDCWPDGAWFIELAPVRDPDRVSTALAGVLGVKESAERSLTESLANFLRRKKLLLILDNCEHLVEAAAVLASAILHECPEVRILATSRQPLGMTGERPHRVSSLAIPPEHRTLSKEEAPEYGAIALFADRARIATETFDITDDNVGVVAQICRRLDGIALALELAAPWLKMLTLEQLNKRLSERFRVLTGGSRDALPRQQTMHALIDWSYDLLDEDERRFFRRLCVFAGDFSLEAAAALGGDESLDEWRSFELLSSLVDKSLVTSELVDSQRRYRLLESMRAYALEKASEFGDVNELRVRHAEYYTSLAERAWTTYTEGGSRSDYRRMLEPDREQFLAVLGWALAEREKPEAGARLLTMVRLFLISRGFAAAASRWAEAALAVDLAPPVQASLWLTLAETQNALYVPKRQLQASLRARQLYEALDDRAGLVQALEEQALAQMRLGALEEAEATSHRALVLCRERGDRRSLIRALNNISICLKEEGRAAEARAASREALELLRALGDQHGVVVTLLNIAETEFQLGEVENAVASAKEVLNREAARADTALLTNQKNNLAAYLFALGQLDAGRREATDALKIAVGGEYHVYAAWALHHLAAMIAPADPNRAGQLIGYVESIFTASNVTRQYTERYTYDRLMTTLRKNLSEDEIAALAREGAALNEAQAVELAQRTE